MMRLQSCFVLMVMSACGGGAQLGPGPIALGGTAQKGPFVAGSPVAAGELDDALQPTGNNISGMVVDDSGAFALADVDLESPYVEVVAKGFYFDEVAGIVSTSSIQLSTLADVRDATTINVNVLGHLAAARIRTLVAGGSSFASAKATAQSELLSIFGITGAVAPAAGLDLAKGSYDDAVLLAVSAILQAGRGSSDLATLLAKLAADFGPDGRLDSAALAKELALNAALLDVAAVRAHLAARYQTIGAAATFGDFESIVQNFVATSPYAVTDPIIYPAAGTYNGQPTVNLIAPGVTQGAMRVGEYRFSLIADVPATKSVRVRITSSEGAFNPSFNEKQGDVSYMQTSDGAWEVLATALATAELRSLTVSGTFTTAQPKLTVEIYENGAAVANRVNHVTFYPLVASDPLTYPATGMDQLGNVVPNLLADGVTTLHRTSAEGAYSNVLIANVPATETIRVRLTRITAGMDLMVVADSPLVSVAALSDGAEATTQPNALSIVAPALISGASAPNGAQLAIDVYANGKGTPILSKVVTLE